MVTGRIDGVRLLDVAPAVARLRANMIGQQEAPLKVHIEVGTGVTSDAHRVFQLVPPAVAEPATEQLTLGCVARLALLWVEALSQILDPRANGIVLRVTDRFAYAADIYHHRFSSFSLPASYERSHW